MSGTIQTGTANIVGARPVLALSYSNSQCLILTCRTHSVYAAYSEQGLEQENTRFKIQKLNDAASEGPDGLTIPFIKASSGTIFFASANGADSAILSMWSIDCDGGDNY